MLLVPRAGAWGAIKMSPFGPALWFRVAFGGTTFAAGSFWHPHSEEAGADEIVYKRIVSTSRWVKEPGPTFHANMLRHRCSCVVVKLLRCYTLRFVAPRWLRFARNGKRYWRIPAAFMRVIPSGRGAFVHALGGLTFQKPLMERLAQIYGVVHSAWPQRSTGVDQAVRRRAVVVAAVHKQAVARALECGALPHRGVIGLLESPQCLPLCGRALAARFEWRHPTKAAVPR